MGEVSGGNERVMCLFMRGFNLEMYGLLWGKDSHRECNKKWRFANLATLKGSHEWCEVMDFGKIIFESLKYACIYKY